MSAWQDLQKEIYRIGVLNSTGGVLTWDNEVNLPVKGQVARAEQSGVIAGMVHDLWSQPKVAQGIEKSREELSEKDPEQLPKLEAIARTHKLKTALPQSLVEELVRLESSGQHTWKKAREKSDYSLFAPVLEKMLPLKRQVAECWGYENHPYEALLGEYEPESNLEEIAGVLEDLAKQLSERLQGWRGNLPSTSKLLERTFCKKQQQKYVTHLLEQIGFDFEAGRLDKAVHPFCLGIHAGDVRLTNRYYEDKLSVAIFGALHEGGHGLYEQGLPQEFAFMPFGSGASLGMHESQSRLWENIIGRSLGFWQHQFPHLQKFFPKELGDSSAKEFYRSVNLLRDNFIRVNADEITYNLHVVLRFEIEKALLDGSLAVKDLPSVWNARFKELFGFEVTDDSVGCLQDVHWSCGLFGYFPTYSIGNLMSAQLWDCYREEKKEFDYSEQDLRHLLTWLREKVHQKASLQSGLALCKEVTGEGLKAEPFLSYIDKKYQGLLESSSDG